MKTKTVLYTVSNIFSHHIAHKFLPQSFDFHHFITHKRRIVRMCAREAYREWGYTALQNSALEMSVQPRSSTALPLEEIPQLHMR